MRVFNPRFCIFFIILPTKMYTTCPKLEAFLPAPPPPPTLMNFKKKKKKKKKKIKPSKACEPDGISPK